MELSLRNRPDYSFGVRTLTSDDATGHVTNLVPDGVQNSAGERSVLLSRLSRVLTLSTNTHFVELNEVFLLNLTTTFS